MSYTLLVLTCSYLFYFLHVVCCVLSVSNKDDDDGVILLTEKGKNISSVAVVTITEKAHVPRVYHVKPALSQNKLITLRASCGTCSVL